jgi:hypothetical protein
MMIPDVLNQSFRETSCGRIMNYITKDGCSSNYIFSLNYPHGKKNCIIFHLKDVMYIYFSQDSSLVLTLKWWRSLFHSCSQKFASCCYGNIGGNCTAVRIVSLWGWITTFSSRRYLTKSKYFDIDILRTGHGVLNVNCMVLLIFHYDLWSHYSVCGPWWRWPRG